MSELATQELADSANPNRDVRPSQGLRLLVERMAASGVARGEIATRLRDRFGVRGAIDVVDRVLEPHRG